MANMMLQNDGEWIPRGEHEANATGSGNYTDGNQNSYYSQSMMIGGQGQRQRPVGNNSRRELYLVLIAGVLILGISVAIGFFDVPIPFLNSNQGTPSSSGSGGYDPPESYQYDPPPEFVSDDSEEDGPQKAYPNLRSGPLIGHTTFSSTTVWILQGRGKTLYLRYWEKENKDDKEEQEHQLTSTGDDSTFDTNDDGVTNSSATANNTNSSIWAMNVASDGGDEEKDEEEEDVNIIPMPPNMPGGSSIVEITGLKSLTTYTYQILLFDEGNTGEEGVDIIIVAESQFQTAPPQTSTSIDKPIIGDDGEGDVASDVDVGGGGSKFRYVLASCMNVRSYPNQMVWKTILEEHQPNFALLPGDTIYLSYHDWNGYSRTIDFERFIIRNIEQRDEPNFADFISTVPTYSTWDDHDFGSNNSNKYQNGKEHSLQGFKSVWGNPYYDADSDADDALATFEGNYYTFQWSNDVQFFVLDCRWYRDDSNGVQFGTKQLDWLFNQLLQSKAIFKVIVTGIDVLERGMSSDTTILLGQFVTKHSISGILFHSGDIHRNELKIRTYRDTWPYPVVQITSSGIGMVWRRPFAIIDIDTTTTTTSTSQHDPTLKVSFYGAKDKSIDTEWINDPNLQCTSIEGTDRGKEHSCTETIRLSQLSP